MIFFKFCTELLAPPLASKFTTQLKYVSCPQNEQGSAKIEQGIPKIKPDNVEIEQGIPVVEHCIVEIEQCTPEIVQGNPKIEQDIAEITKSFEVLSHDEVKPKNRKSFISSLTYNACGSSSQTLLHNENLSELDVEFNAVVVGGIQSLSTNKSEIAKIKKSNQDTSSCLEISGSSISVFSTSSLVNFETLHDSIIKETNVKPSELSELHSEESEHNSEKGKDCASPALSGRNSLKLEECVSDIQIHQKRSSKDSGMKSLLDTQEKDEREECTNFGIASGQSFGHTDITSGESNIETVSRKKSRVHDEELTNLNIKPEDSIATRFSRSQQNMTRLSKTKVVSIHLAQVDENQPLTSSILTLRSEYFLEDSSSHDDRSKRVSYMSRAQVKILQTEKPSQDQPIIVSKKIKNDKETESKYQESSLGLNTTAAVKNEMHLADEKTKSGKSKSIGSRIATRCKKEFIELVQKNKPNTRSVKEILMSGTEDDKIKPSKHELKKLKKQKTKNARKAKKGSKFDAKKEVDGMKFEEGNNNAAETSESVEKEHQKQSPTDIDKRRLSRPTLTDSGRDISPPTDSHAVSGRDLRNMNSKSTNSNNPDDHLQPTIGDHGSIVQSSVDPPLQAQDTGLQVCT